MGLGPSRPEREPIYSQMLWTTLASAVATRCQPVFKSLCPKTVRDRRFLGVAAPAFRLAGRATSAYCGQSRRKGCGMPMTANGLTKLIEEPGELVQVAAH